MSDTSRPTPEVIALLLEAAHRHVTLGHHEQCGSVLRAYRDEPCDCGFSEAREALKAVES